MSNDAFGARMKAYEAVTKQRLMPHSLTILRVDGRAFHTYLKASPKPFDMFFIEAMQLVGTDLCEQIPGTVMAYGQSDEISLLISDRAPQAEAWFGGVVQKMASVAAAMATISLARLRSTRGAPHFDARVFTVPSAVEAANYFIWRQKDAIRNSVSMAAQALWPPEQLLNVPMDQLQEMMFKEHGIDWNNYPDTAKRGWVLTKQTRFVESTFTDARDSTQRTIEVIRERWEASTPHLTVDWPLFAALQEE